MQLATAVDEQMARWFRSLIEGLRAGVTKFTAMVDNLPSTASQFPASCKRDRSTDEHDAICCVLTGTSKNLNITHNRTIVVST